MFKVQSSKLIEIEHLSAGYEGKEVLHDINLTVCKDDYLGIIGPNGGGKTTLMRLILGLMKPTDGSIRFYKDGEEVREISMGYLPQYNHLDKQFLSPSMKWYSQDSARPKVSFRDTPRHSTSRFSTVWNRCSSRS